MISIVFLLLFPASGAYDQAVERVYTILLSGLQAAPAVPGQPTVPGGPVSQPLFYHFETCMSLRGFVERELVLSKGSLQKTSCRILPNFVEISCILSIRFGILLLPAAVFIVELIKANPSEMSAKNRALDVTKKHTLVCNRMHLQCVTNKSLLLIENDFFLIN